MTDDPSLTRSQELIKEFNYDKQEDVEGCVASWSIKLEKDLHMDFGDIDYDSREKIKTKDKQTLSGWLVDAVDLVRRQKSQMYLLKEIIECFKTEALADKEKVIRLQGQLLVQKDEQLELLKTSVEETVQTTVESGIQSYSAAVQQNSASGKVCNSNTLKKVIKSVAAEEDRSKNLIVFGLKAELKNTYLTYFIKYQKNVKYGVFYFRWIKFVKIRYKWFCSIKSSNEIISTISNYTS